MDRYSQSLMIPRYRRIDTYLDWPPNGTKAALPSDALMAAFHWVRWAEAHPIPSYSPRVSNDALPPAAVVLIVNVLSVANRNK